MSVCVCCSGAQVLRTAVSVCMLYSFFLLLCGGSVVWPAVSDPPLEPQCMLRREAVGACQRRVSGDADSPAGGPVSVAHARDAKNVMLCYVMMLPHCSASGER